MSLALTGDTTRFDQAAGPRTSRPGARIANASDVIPSRAATILWGYIELKSTLAWVRRAQRGIRMVSELHRMGYQRLRIMPYSHPLGWRLAIDSADRFAMRHGAVIAKEIVSSDRVIGAGGIFWDDTDGDNARALADKFVARFPGVSARGIGRDWCYAGWLAELVGYLEGGDWLPVTEWEYMKGEPQELGFCRSGRLPAATSMRTDTSGFRPRIADSFRCRMHPIDKRFEGDARPERRFRRAASRAGGRTAAPLWRHPAFSIKARR